MTTGTETLGNDVATGRLTRLSDRVRLLRTRAGRGELDRWLLVAGGALMPVGVLLIVLGWLGAARTPLVFEQIPYAISGGALGLALVFAGGFVYFAYWQTVRIRDSRAAQRQLTDALARVEALLGGTALPGPREPGYGAAAAAVPLAPAAPAEAAAYPYPAAPAAPYPAAAAAGESATPGAAAIASAAALNGMPANGGVPLVSTGRGTMFHRLDCPIVAGRENLQSVDASDTSLRPCRICEPLGTHAG